MRLLHSLAAFAIIGTYSAPALAQSGNIPYRERVTLDIGQSAIVHSIRGECGQPPTCRRYRFPR